MRLISAFFLAFFVYSAILFFFIYFIFFKQNQTKTQIVYVHQVIKIDKQKIPHKISNLKIKKISENQKSRKTPKKEIKTNSTLSKGGKNIKIDDIFSNISDNIKTEKVEQKKSEKMTKKTGISLTKEIQNKLSSLKSTQKIKISMMQTQGLKSDANYLEREFYKKWINMDIFEPNKEVDIQVSIQNGVMELYVIATNLDTIRLNSFIKELKSVNVSKINNFTAKFIFKSKLKE